MNFHKNSLKTYSAMKHAKSKSENSITTVVTSPSAANLRSTLMIHRTFATFSSLLTFRKTQNSNKISERDRMSIRQRLLSTILMLDVQNSLKREEMGLMMSTDWTSCLPTLAWRRCHQWRFPLRIKPQPFSESTRNSARHWSTLPSG